MAMGMTGFIVVRPKNPAFIKIDRDFVYLISAHDIVPKVATMTDSDLRSWNSRVFPGIAPLVVRKGDQLIESARSTQHP